MDGRFVTNICCKHCNVCLFEINKEEDGVAQFKKVCFKLSRDAESASTTMTMTAMTTASLTHFRPIQFCIEITFHVLKRFCLGRNFAASASFYFLSPPQMIRLQFFSIYNL